MRGVAVPPEGQHHADEAGVSLGRCRRLIGRRKLTMLIGILSQASNASSVAQVRVVMGL